MKHLLATLLSTMIICCIAGCASVMDVLDGRRTVGEVAADATITSSLYTAYLKDEQLDALDIDIDTYRGVVTLNGLVANQEAAMHAINLALDTRNVTRVISNLTIRTQALSLRGVVYEKQ